MSNSEITTPPSIEWIADYLNLNPNNPLYWPYYTLTKLQNVYKYKGKEEFQIKIFYMMKGN